LLVSPPHCWRFRYIRARADTGAKIVEEVDFSTSCSPAVQHQFNHAVWTLRSFWYPEALKDFTAVTEADPNCAIGYWGIAMSHWYPLWYSPSSAALTVLPARELLADLLLELNQPAAALTEYKAVLQTDPNRFRSLLGEARAAKQAGDLTTAQNAYKKLVTLSKPSGPERPELAEARAYLTN
jgi:tetratricopeptide (TPR) repeat protein